MSDRWQPAPRAFPFSEVVGQDDAKLALLLVAVDPRIGGVLLRGEKGSAKTTLARGLAGLLDETAPFVELPLGATEDRLIGTLDITKALIDQQIQFTPGLLAKADRGVLYVDEVNLLADHLVDALLDVSVSGVNRVERDGVSHQHPSRFVLIGSMNPEEGELRPQLLDRFGLCVEVTASRNPQERSEAVRRRLAFDRAAGETTTPGAGSQGQDAELIASLNQAAPGPVPDDIIETASKLALGVGAEGLRADLVLCRAAAAHAALHGRTEVGEDDLRRVAPLVLAHRSRRNPFDPPMLPPEQITQIVDDTLDQDQTAPDTDETPGNTQPTPPAPPDADGNNDRHDEGRGSHSRPMAIGADRALHNDDSAADRITSLPNHGAPGRRLRTESDRGRYLRDVTPEPGAARSVAVAATVRQVADRRSIDPEAAIELGDIRHAVKERLAGSLLVLAVDVSGSMGAEQRAQAATGTALGLLTEAYQRRDHVAVVTFGGAGATVALAPTGSIEVARHRLTSLETGGPTPLADGIRQALTVATTRRDTERQPMLVLLSDCRATGEGQELGDALQAASEVARQEIPALVLDCETGEPRLGLARRIAEAMGARCVDVADLDSAGLTSMIRSAAEGLTS